MELNVSDLLVLIDAAYAAGRLNTEGGLKQLGCKYTSEQIFDAAINVNRVVGSMKMSVRKVKPRGLESEIETPADT